MHVPRGGLARLRRLVFGIGLCCLAGPAFAVVASSGSYRLLAGGAVTGGGEAASAGYDHCGAQGTGGGYLADSANYLLAPSFCVRPAATPFSLDVDGDTAVALANDGYLVLRDFLFRDLFGPGYLADLLTGGLAKSPGALRWDTPGDVKAYLEAMRGALATDIDGDATVLLANDGYLILRDFLFRDLFGDTYLPSLLTGGLEKTENALYWDDPQAIKDRIGTLR